MKTKKLKKPCKLIKTFVKVFLKNSLQLFLAQLDDFTLVLLRWFLQKNLRLGYEWGNV